MKCSSGETLSPQGLGCFPLYYVWLAPWAAFLRRLAAKSVESFHCGNKNLVLTYTLQTLYILISFTRPVRPPFRGSITVRSRSLTTLTIS